MDDFSKKFAPECNVRLLSEGERQRLRPCCLSLAELMILVMLFHQLRYRQFKSFWLNHAYQHLRAEFPGLPSYSRCVELLPRYAVALHAFFDTLKGKCSGISMADSTPAAVCHRLRIKRHRVFRDMAMRLWGRLYADRGYISNTLTRKLKE